MTSTKAELDLLTHSPDGESRGLLARVGDLFPLDPSHDLTSGSSERASSVRPWGLRFLKLPTPRMGKHDDKTSSYTTGGGQDNQTKEDWGKD